jgi:hypothetical protein
MLSSKQAEAKGRRQRNEVEGRAAISAKRAEVVQLWLGLKEREALL